MVDQPNGVTKTESRAMFGLIGTLFGVVLLLFGVVYSNLVSDQQRQDAKVLMIEERQMNVINRLSSLEGKIDQLEKDHEVNQNGPNPNSTTSSKP